MQGVNPGTCSHWSVPMCVCVWGGGGEGEGAHACKEYAWCSGGLSLVCCKTLKLQPPQTLSPKKP